MIRFALIAVLAGAAAAQDKPAPAESSPEQYPGQLEKMRFALLYPKFKPESIPSASGTAAERRDAFLDDSATVLKNVGKLLAYLHEGLRDPRVTKGAREWEGAWTRLDAESRTLDALAQTGEALLREGVPARARRFVPRRACPAAPARAEFPAERGEAHRAAAARAAYVCALRAEVELKGARARGASGLDARLREAEADAARAHAAVLAGPARP